MRVSTNVLDCVPSSRDLEIRRSATSVQNMYPPLHWVNLIQLQWHQVGAADHLSGIITIEKYKGLLLTVCKLSLYEHDKHCMNNGKYNCGHTFSMQDIHSHSRMAWVSDAATNAIINYFLHIHIVVFFQKKKSLGKA